MSIPCTCRADVSKKCGNVYTSLGSYRDRLTFWSGQRESNPTLHSLEGWRRASRLAALWIIVPVTKSGATVSTWLLNFSHSFIGHALCPVFQ